MQNKLDERRFYAVVVMNAKHTILCTVTQLRPESILVGLVRRLFRKIVHPPTVHRRADDGNSGSALAGAPQYAHLNAKHRGISSRIATTASDHRGNWVNQLIEHEKRLELILEFLKFAFAVSKRRQTQCG